MEAIFRVTGRTILDASRGAGYGLLLLAQAAYWLQAANKRRKEILAQLHFAGIKSLTVVLVVAVFTGMILAVQTGRELARFQQQSLVGALISVTLCREMGPFMTAIILAATVGSAMAAEIGTMRVSEEIDALEMMAIHPAMYLVMPRVAALTLMCPALTLVTDAVGTLGGAVVSRSLLNVGYYGYFDNVREFLELKDIYTGLFKSIIFGLIVSTVGCTQGMLTRGGAQGVGAATRNAVVYSMLLILVFGYFLTRFFYDIT